MRRTLESGLFLPESVFHSNPVRIETRISFCESVRGNGWSVLDFAFEPIGCSSTAKCAIPRSSFLAELRHRGCGTFNARALRCGTAWWRNDMHFTSIGIYCTACCVLFGLLDMATSAAWSKSQSIVQKRADPFGVKCRALQYEFKRKRTLLLTINKEVLW